MNKTILAVSGAGLVGLIAFLLVQFSNVEVKENGSVEVKVGETKEAEAGCYQDGPNCLPPIDFTDTTGKVWTPEMLKGKVVVVNFWATWCKPCQHEVPDLANVQKKHQGKDVVILGMLSDKPSDEKLKVFNKQYGLNYPVVRVTPEISEAFGHPRALPTNFVYSPGGHLVFDRPGAVSAESLEGEIQQLL